MKEFRIILLVAVVGFGWYQLFAFFTKPPEKTWFEKSWEESSAKSKRELEEAKREQALRVQAEIDRRNALTPQQQEEEEKLRRDNAVLEAYRRNEYNRTLQAVDKMEQWKHEQRAKERERQLYGN